jgi:hypothetical protein
VVVIVAVLDKGIPPFPEQITGGRGKKAILGDGATARMAGRRGTLERIVSHFIENR